ncbi:MAG: T9SS type A sorting domain-containing protein [Flavipsychrobacter sp.]|nr:T9SS type A sorting domain-containing protein [Flavipsychrobacter sp.]
MLKKVLLFTTLIFGVAIAIMSNENGLAHINNMNRTGSDGSATIGCGGNNCHNGGQYLNDSVPPHLTVLDVFSNPVNCFMPGNTYIIKLRGSSNAPKWAFQASASHLDSSGNRYPAGWISGQSPWSWDVFVGNYSVVEQKQKLTVVDNMMETTLFWLAPTMPIVDTVYFSFTILNCNDDGTIDGDNSNTYIDTLGHWTPETVSLNEPFRFDDGLKIKAFPNPLTDRLFVGLDNLPTGKYALSVFDVRGRVLNRQEVEGGSYTAATVDASNWAAGVYHVLVNKDGFKKTALVVKQ